MSSTEDLTKAILRTLKIDWVNSFIKLRCYLTNGFEWGAPLTKPRPIGKAHPKREIPNFAGMSVTKELAEAILSGPLKLIGLIPLLNYTII